MHRNYYSFQREVEFLNDHISGAIINKCFSHRKNELVLELEGKQPYYLRLSVNVHRPYLLLYQPQNIRDPQISIFAELRQKKIRNCSITAFDKSVDIFINSYLLKAVFYGKGANIYLFDPDRKIIGSFKKHTEYVENKGNLQQLSPEKISPDGLIDLAASAPASTLQSFLSREIGGFNLLLARETAFRTKLDPLCKLKTVSEIQWPQIVDNLNSVFTELTRDPVYIFSGKDAAPILSLVFLQHLSPAFREEKFDTINEAWIHYLKQIWRSDHREKFKSLMIGGLRKRIAYLERTLKKIAEVEDLEKRKVESELKGHLLQTFAHEIARGEEKVQLKNIFSKQQEMVLIKLNPAKSVQENARKYFEKYKDIATKKEQITIKKDTYQRELAYWQDLLQQAGPDPSIKTLDKLHKILMAKNLIQAEEPKKENHENLAFSFNRLLLAKKWEIFIGKNAANNDLLTFRFARKFDLWFHAQGVPGSHVIIRLPDRTQHPPRTVIEQTAAIAAYHSEARHSTRVPVNYTEVRYVRKPRKSAPGMAIISNEKSIFVKPLKMT